MVNSTCEPLFSKLDTPPRRLAAGSGIIWGWTRDMAGGQLMNVPRVRFTVRWIMVAVAVVAVGLGVRAQLARWHQLKRSYEIRALSLGRSVAAF
jgi:ABC-type Fe3+ transport system permease subunit